MQRVARVGPIRLPTDPGIRARVAGAIVRFARWVHGDAGAVMLPDRSYIRVLGAIVLGPGAEWRNTHSIYERGDYFDFPEVHR